MVAGLSVRFGKLSWSGLPGVARALTIGVGTGLVARAIGSPWLDLPIVALFFTAVEVVFDPDARGRAGDARRPRGSSFEALISAMIRGRTVPRAIQFLVVTFFVTSLFALEMKIDIVPNQYGFLELLLPTFASTIFFGAGGGLFAAALTALFAYDVFVPPRFSPIFQPGPEFSSLVAFTVVSLVLTLFTIYCIGGLRRPELEAPDWRDLTTGVWRRAAGRSRAFLLARVSRREILVPALCVCVYSLFWAIYGAVSAENGPHVDSLEAYSWGREFRLGYFKHPPFWSWVAGAWFLVFPRTPFWFFLLSEFNSALGLAGTWALLGRFCAGPTRLLALLLLLLTPFYQFNALRFNANTILLSIWPWATYFFIRSIETRRFPAAIASGLLFGIALLSKYFGLVLIASCFLGAITHHDRRVYFRSAVPWVSGFVTALIFSPHVIWLFRDGFQPLAYMASKGMFSEAEIADSYFTFIAANILYFAIPLAIVLGARLFHDGGEDGRQQAPVRNGPSFLTVLAFSPFVLTLVAGAVGHTALAVPFGTPVFALVPLVVILVAKPPVEFALFLGKRAVALLMAGCALAAAFVPYVSLRWGSSRGPEPRAEVAELAPRVWAGQTGAPLRYVAGSEGYALATTFHAPGNVSEFRQFNFRWAPWVTPRALREHGLLAICEHEDEDCLAAAANFATPETRRVEAMVAREAWGHAAPARRVVFLVTPPRP